MLGVYYISEQKVLSVLGVYYISGQVLFVLGVYYISGQTVLSVLGVYHILGQDHLCLECGLFWDRTLTCASIVCFRAGH